MLAGFLVLFISYKIEDIENFLLNKDSASKENKINSS